MDAPRIANTEMHRIATTGIVWRKGEDGVYRYLITKRSPHKKVMPGKWTVPGGGIESDDYTSSEASYLNEESPQWYGAVEAALRRELREEVGLEVGEVSYLLDVAFIRPDGIPVIVLSYYCAYQGGEIVLDGDATEYAWVTAEELQDYDLISGIDHEIMEVQKRLTT